ncbi:MAG: 4'-phosphopantetheinyl transferase superfamily protein [Opitutaceae bacterium]|jgi:4'-phosphopantetheinyl transferase
MTFPWQIATPPGPLAADVVHVWRASLDPEEIRLDDFRPILSADEQTRAARFRFEKDRQHFVIAHSVLRLLLSAYLGVEPKQVRLVADDRGKPRLADQTDGSIRFNLSHSGALALYALCLGREVGVDVEKVDRSVEPMAVARRMFTPSEAGRLEALLGEERTTAFFELWTRMEALAKATGHGLGSKSANDGFLPVNDGATLGGAKGQPGDEAGWQTVSLQPGAGYAGAVAAQGTDWTIRCWEWSNFKNTP